MSENEKCPAFVPDENGACTEVAECNTTCALPLLQDLGLQQGWRIENLAALEWALERLAGAQVEVAETEALEDQAVARVHAQTQLATASARHSVEYFTQQILAYVTAHRGELLRDDRKKSRSFPGGTVGFRVKHKGGALAVQDEAACLAWAQAQPAVLGLVTQKPVLVKTALNKYFADMGEVPPGCDFVPETDEPYVKSVAVDLKIGVAPTGMVRR